MCIRDRNNKALDSTTLKLRQAKQARDLLTIAIQEQNVVLASNSQAKLANLSEKALSGLHKLNALELIYSHFLSLSKVQSVANLANLKNKSGRKSLKERAIDRQKETADKEVDSLVKNLLDSNITCVEKTA